MGVGQDVTVGETPKTATKAKGALGEGHAEVMGKSRSETLPCKKPWAYGQVCAYGQGQCVCPDCQSPQAVPLVAIPIEGR